MHNQRLISYLGAFVTLLAGVFLFFRGVLFHFPVTTLWASAIDTPLCYWIINWGYHVLIELHNPAGFFNANSFFPQQNTLAFSDSLLGLQIFYAPFRLIGFDSLASIYLALACLVILSGLLTVAGLRRVEPFSPWEVSFLLFGSFFTLPATNYLIHYQLFAFFLIPSFLVFLFLFFRDLRPSDLAWVCAIYTLAVMISLYLAPILFLYSIFLSPPIILFYARQNGTPYLKKLIDWRHFLIPVSFGLLLYFIQLRPYFLVNNQPSTDTVERVILFSGLPLSIFQNVSEFSFWYPPGSAFPGAWESAYFPGYTLLLLGLAFLLHTLIGAFFHHRASSLSPGAKSTDLFTVSMILFFLLSWLFSLGPYLKQDTSSAFSVRLPSYYLAQIIPGMDQLRAPGRFGMMIGFPLSLVGLRFLHALPGGQRSHRVVLILSFLILAVESFPAFPVYPFQPDPTGVYHWLSKQIRPGQSLVELPLSTIANQGEDKYVFAMRQLVGSTIHWGRIAAGYGAKETREYQALMKSDLALQADQGQALNILQQAGKYGFEYLMVDVRAYSLAGQASWRSLAGSCSPVRYYSPGEVMLVHIPSCR